MTYLSNPLLLHTQIVLTFPIIHIAITIFKSYSFKQICGNITAGSKGILFEGCYSYILPIHPTKQLDKYSLPSVVYENAYYPSLMNILLYLGKFILFILFQGEK